MPKFESNNKFFFKIYRSFKGLSVTVKVAPEIEDLFRELSRDSGHPTAPVNLYGPCWTPKRGLKPESLQVYGIPDGHQLNAEQYTADGDMTFRVNRPGTRLDSPVNLSLIRLVGASSEDGVTFDVSGAVYMEAQIDDLLNRLQKAATDFYKLYFKEVSRSLLISVEKRSS